MTRGNKTWVDWFIKRLEGICLPFEYRFDVKKKMQKRWFEVGVRPIQFWEIVYPEPCHELMCHTILDQKMGETQHKKHEKVLWGMRKMMGLKKIDYNWKPKKIIKEFAKQIPLDHEGKIPIVKEHIEPVGVGFKKDRYTPHGEML